MAHTQEKQHVLGGQIRRTGGEGESGGRIGRAASLPKAAHIRKRKGKRVPSPGGEK